MVEVLVELFCPEKVELIRTHFNKLSMESKHSMDIAISKILI